MKRGPGALRKIGRKRSFISGHLARKLALAVLIAGVAIEAAMLVPLYQQSRERFILEMRRDVATLFQAAVDPRTFPDLEGLVASGENLLRTTKIVGGAYLSGVGEIQAVFGETPVLTWADARLDGRSWRLAPDVSRFEMFLAPERTGASHAVVLKVDSTERWQGVVASLRETALFGFGTTLVLALIIWALAASRVVRPLGAMREAIEFALDEPRNAQSRLSNLRGRDELGAVSRAIDQLLVFTTFALEEELAAAQAVSEHNPHGVLTFSAAGYLLSANPAALRMFDAPDCESLGQRDPLGLIRFRGEAIGPQDLLSQGGICGPGDVLREDDALSCLVAGDVVRREDGSVMRLLMVLVDMAEAGDERNALEDQIHLMHSHLKACLVLLGQNNAEERPAERADCLLHDLAEQWRSETHGRRIAAHISCPDLPPVLADPEEMPRLFATALDVILQRSVSKHPEIAVAASVDGESVTVTIGARSSEGGERPFGEIDTERDANLLIAALGVLVRRQGGAVVATCSEEGRNALSFTLPKGSEVSVSRGSVVADAA